MDQRLFQAAHTGQASFAREILRLKPSSAMEINHQGFSPAHIASANGHLDVVRELLKVVNDVCFLKGKGGLIPLHCAALRGRIDVIKQLSSACPQSLKEATVYHETAIHVAVKSNQVEAARVLLEEIKRFDMLEILNWINQEGNRVLHLATFTKQHEIIKILIDQEAIVPGVEVNIINSSGFTPKDILDVILETEGGNLSETYKLVRMFQKVGGMKPGEIVKRPSSRYDQIQSGNDRCLSSEPSRRWNLWRELNREIAESSAATQNALMVVAVLISTVTYQAILSPPSGFWGGEAKNSHIIGGIVQRRTALPGEAVMASDPEIFAVFTVFNAVGFFASIAMISLLTSGFPLRACLRLAILSMTATYVIAVIYMAPTKLKTVCIVVAMMVVVVFLEFVRFVIWLLKKLKLVDQSCGIIPLRKKNMFR